MKFQLLRGADGQLLSVFTQSPEIRITENNDIHVGVSKEKNMFKVLLLKNTNMVVVTSREYALLQIEK